MNSHFKKYLKYKTKYLKLKEISVTKQLGSGCSKREIDLLPFNQLLINPDCDYSQLSKLDLSKVIFNINSNELGVLLSKNFPVDFLIIKGYTLGLFKSYIDKLRSEYKPTEDIIKILKELKKIKQNNIKNFTEAGFALKDLLMMEFNLKSNGYTIENIIENYDEDIDIKYLKPAGFTKEEI